MRITDRVREIVEMNLTNHYISLMVHTDPPRVFPMYFGCLVEDNLLAFPVTDATGIGNVLGKTTRASVLVADRAGGYEAYVLEGEARYVTDKLDYLLASAAQNEVPGFPIHGAVVFKLEAAHLTPPP